MSTHRKQYVQTLNSNSKQKNTIFKLTDGLKNVWWSQIPAWTHKVQDNYHCTDFQRTQMTSINVPTLRVLQMQKMHLLLPVKTQSYFLNSVFMSAYFVQQLHKSLNWLDNRELVQKTNIDFIFWCHWSLSRSSQIMWTMGHLINILRKKFWSIGLCQENTILLLAFFYTALTLNFNQGHRNRFYHGHGQNQPDIKFTGKGCVPL